MSLDTLQGLGAVAFVLLLLGAVLFLLKRRGIADFGGFEFSKPGAKPPRRLEVLERAALGPRHSLFLVRVGGADWLLATSPEGCQFQTVSFNQANKSETASI